MLPLPCGPSKRRMKEGIVLKRNLAALLLLALLAIPAAAPGDEGDPLLSVDDLLTLEESYEAFLR